MWRALFPGPAPRRVLALTTLVGAVGKGIFLTAGVLYFSQIVRLPSLHVGYGLSVAGGLSILFGLLAGHLADRRGPRRVYVTCLTLCALATAAFCVTGDFWLYLFTVCVVGCTYAALPIVRGPIINHIGGERPQKVRAYLRAVTNVGIAAGAAVAGFAAQANTRAAYLWLFLANTVLLAAAALIGLALPDAPSAPRADGPRWIALRDRPYLALSLLDGILSIQYRVMTVALPLWILTFTDAPRWLISAAVVVNTAIVILFQVRASGNVDTPRAAGVTLRRSGLAFLAACALISLSAGVPPWTAAALILTACLVHSIGELWQTAGGFEVSNALAAPDAVGQYLGVFGIGMGLAESLGPTLLIALCIGWGRSGWYVLGAVFALSGLLVPYAVRWAEATRPSRAATAQSAALNCCGCR
jgi:hypothetical protein